MSESWWGDGSWEQSKVVARAWFFSFYLRHDGREGAQWGGSRNLCTICGMVLAFALQERRGPPFLIDSIWNGGRGRHESGPSCLTVSLPFSIYSSSSFQGFTLARRGELGKFVHNTISLIPVAKQESFHVRCQALHRLVNCFFLYCYLPHSFLSVIKSCHLNMFASMGWADSVIFWLLDEEKVLPCGISLSETTHAPSTLCHVPFIDTTSIHRRMLRLTIVHLGGSIKPKHHQTVDTPRFVS